MRESHSRQSRQMYSVGDDAGVRTVVELLHVQDCPNGADYLPHLRALLAATGMSTRVRVKLMTNPDQAVREQFLGSPTVRVNGRDVDPDAAGRSEYGLSCRIYATTEGLRGTPPDRWVLDALHPS